MQWLDNPYINKDFCTEQLAPFPPLRSDSVAVQKLLELCPVHHVTPLICDARLSDALGVCKVLLKIEEQRMGLGSFKALGAAYVIAKHAAAIKTDTISWERALEGETFITASAGNHGLSLAAGARIFGAKAVIVLSKTVPESFAQRLHEKGTDVIIAGKDYQQSLDKALELSQEKGWQLVSDTTWPDYIDTAMDVMEGYTQLADEITQQVPSSPSHVFLQAGVGGLASAAARVLRKHWGTSGEGGPQIIIVEPEAAPALLRSIAAQKPLVTQGPVSDMGRLDCKEPSWAALKSLAQDADAFMTITEEEAQEGVKLLNSCGVKTSSSGGAGFAGALAAKERLDINAKLLFVISEGVA